MTRRTDNLWRTDRCGRCGEQHNNYHGKLDRHGVEYVICGRTNKRMNVTTRDNSIADQSGAFATKWEKQYGYSYMMYTQGDISLMLSLLDGASDIIELYKADSPSQIEWKKQWLRNSKELVDKVTR